MAKKRAAMRLLDNFMFVQNLFSWVPQEQHPELH